MLHGENEAKKIEETAKKVFSENSSGLELPAVSINVNLLGKNFNIVDLIILSKLESSKSEIKRLIKGNGVKINNQLIIDEKLIITKQLFINNFIKLSVGKKRHVRIDIS